MAKILISFLGTGRKDKNNVSKYAYEQAYYQFGNDKPIATSFFADAMMQHYGINKVFLIGTPGSMLGEVYNHFSHKNGTNFQENKWIELSEYCENAKQDSPLDIPFLQDVEHSMGNESKVVLLHYGLNDCEQQENVAKFLDLEQYINAGDELYVDITHSFRSLPMYIMNLLLYIKVVSEKNVSIRNISYGMYEAYSKDSNGHCITPVVDITDIETIMDWIIGAYSFKEFGNSYKIADLMELEGRKDVTTRLTNFSDMMNLGYLDGIWHQISNFNAMKNFQYSPIPQRLLPQIIDEFNKQFTRVSTASSFKYNIAKWHFEHKNYASSYLVLLEAILTYVQETCEYDYDNAIDNSDFAKVILRAKRESTAKFSNDEIESCRKAMQNHHYGDLCNAVKSINQIRNAIAHQQKREATASSKELIKILKDNLNLVAPVFNTERVFTKRTAKNNISKLVNYSNHPSALWSAEQIQVAHQQFGEIVDISFPSVAPDADEKDIAHLAETELTRISKIAPPSEAVVHIMGEMTLTYALVNLLKTAGYRCVASTTVREVYEEQPGKKTVIFQFVRFRDY